MNFNDVIELLEEIKEEGVPKNIAQQIDAIILYLNQEEDSASKVHKVLSLLDDIANDANIAPHVRTQLWNISSILESFVS
jgi:uncharacterized protein (UPF0147 family)